MLQKAIAVRSISFMSLATAITGAQEANSKYTGFIKAGILAHVQGYAPAVSVEFARKQLMSDARPSFAELEEATATVPTV